MKLKGFQINKFFKWFNIFLASFMLWISITQITRYKFGVSFWDYEGFNFMILSTTISALSLIVFALYLFYRNDFISGSMRIGGFIVMSFVILLLFGGNYKYVLPLKKIETVEIEGTLANEARLSMVEYPDGRISPSVYFKSSDGKSLKEFPNIQFGYLIGFLKDEVVNINHRNPEEMERLNNRHPSINKKLKLNVLDEGTKVKLKVRKKAYENLIAYMGSGQHMDNLPRGEYDKRRSIDFYELSVDGEILVRKFGLK